MKNMQPKDNSFMPKNYLIHGETITIDGRNYPVISIMPISRSSDKAKTAADKIKYLIDGK